jgi:exodeoxyribonuclease V gamma subunit
MLTVHLSNRFESLLDLLARQVQATPGDVYTPTHVIVPSAAVQRAVTLHLADRLGVCANVAFSYPASWIWRQVSRAVPGVASASPFDPQVLAWRVLRAFGDAGFVDAHPRLAAWLARADDVMRYELAARTATLLEQYVTYRPDWMPRWAAGQPAAAAPGLPPPVDEAWQAALWRRIAGELSLADEHPARTMVRALEGGGDIGLPPAVHVVGVPALPPLYVDLLQQLGRCTDIHVHALNPCRAYWFDVVSGRRLSWLAARGQSELFVQGHALLADWGRQTQAFLASLVNVDGDVVIDDGGFRESRRGTLLAALQNAILDMEDMPAASFALADDDRSIELHVCHSATRELEVLQDHLLGLFAGNPAPAPSDIVVVTPDLQATAPLIHAVFGAAPADRHIPYTITGLPERQANPYSRLLLDALSFVRSRCTVGDLFALLQHEAVARRHGLDDAALEDLQAWMRQAGMHWAFDAGHRAHFDVPPTDRHTLDDGLQRLFLGYALPQDTGVPFQDRLPAPGPQGSASRALGALWAVVDTLRGLHAQAARDRPGSEWCALLQALLEDLAAPSRDDLPDLLQLRRSLHALQERMALAGATQPVPLSVVHAALQDALDEPARGGVPSGTVTFASLASLRGLPYRVVCAIGLNDGVVPSAATPSEFDLMAQRPRAGDRVRNVDDRNVFLDLLLAARERVYLSHVGRSVRDNARLPPSILVSELLDHVVRAVALPAAEARARLVVEHPLQPFSHAAFVAGDPRLRSFNQEYARALQLASASAAVALGAAEDDEDDEESAYDPRVPFFREPLAPPDDTWRDVPLTRLVEFFRNPSAYLLKHRMAVELPWSEELLDDDEPLAAGFSQRIALADRLVPHALAGASPDTLKTLAQAGVEYPVGAYGAQQIDTELAMLHDFALRVRADTAEPALPPCRLDVAVDIDGATWRVQADTAGLRRSGLVHHRYCDTLPADYLAGWLHHLLLCAASPAGVAPDTRWHSRDGTYRLPPVADARSLLATLLRLYKRGLQAPLHFFPKSAWAYVTKGDHLGEAEAKWKVTVIRRYTEGADPAHRLALRGVANPLDDEFVECASTVFKPLLECVEDIRL